MYVIAILNLRQTNIDREGLKRRGGWMEVEKEKTALTCP